MKKKKNGEFMKWKIKVLIFLSYDRVPAFYMNYSVTLILFYDFNKGDEKKNNQR